MKRFLLQLLLFGSTIAIGQTTWTGLGANTNWNNAANWDTNLVPTASDDVIIPTGFTVTLSSPAIVKSVDVQGSAIINKTQILNITNASTIGANAIINWHGGNLDGGGTLTNNGTINTFNGNWNVTGTATLINTGSINLTGSGDIGIGTNSVINNTASGIIDFQGDDANFLGAGAAPRTLINSGTIKTTFADPTDKALLFSIEFKNNNGTIQVEAGTLNLNNSTVDGIELTDGVYNVFAGAAFDFANSKATISGTLTGNLAGDFNWRGDVRVNSPNSATFNFIGNATINWHSGNLEGGGTLINDITINTLDGNCAVIGSTTLNNNGNINLTGNGDISISTGSVINNTVSGTIDFQGDDANFLGAGAAPRILNNTGTIKTTFADPTDKALLSVDFKNNNGTVQVEAGTLNLSNSTVDGIELTDGVYNVFVDAALDFANSKTTISGTLTGHLVGDLNWRGNVRVNSTDIAIFDFTGIETISWLSGDLLGGGTLVNESIIATPTSSNVDISEATTLINNSIINLTGTGDIFIGTNSVINNSSSGIIDLQADNSAINATGASPNVLNNAGLLKGSATGIVRIGAEMNNSGTIEVVSGTLLFNGILNHQATGIVKGIASLDLPTDANFTNDGTFAPGASPGILSVIGNFKSSSTSVLDVELNGLLQGTEYDLLDIEGTNVIFDGSINVTMGFEGVIGDEFVIATTTGTISQCTLESNTSAIYNGMQYHFNVTCRNDNEVVLTLANITLGLDDFELTESSILLFPNPVTDTFTIKNYTNLRLESFVIIDLKGCVLQKVDLSDMVTEKTINVQNYASGIYFAQISSGKNSVVKRIVVK